MVRGKGLLGALASLLVFSSFMQAADTREAGALEAYQQYRQAGDFRNAREAGRPLVAAIKAAHPGSPSVASVDKCLAALEDAGLLAQFKLNMIADGASAKRPSPFLYVIPTSRELFERISRKRESSRPAYQGLTPDEASLAASFIDVALRSGDEDVIDAYRKALGAPIDAAAAARAREYLSAYIIGVHEESAYPNVLALLGRTVTGGALPVFLADDALGALRDLRACSKVINALRDVTWAPWPRGEELRLYKSMAAAAESGDDSQWALFAYERIARSGASRDAEDAQSRVIKIHADNENYAKAAEACADYVKRFPGGADALHNEYRKALYRWQAGDFEVAVADAQTFRTAHPGSDLLPEVILLQGLARNSQSRFDEAIALFGEVISKYPNHRFAGKAQFMIGYAYLAGNRLAEARDAFQRVLDFYPGDSYVNQARKHLEKLRNTPAPAR